MNADSGEPRLVPAYAITGGRTAASQDLPWEALVSAAPAGVAALPRLRWEEAHIVALSRRPVAVAEVAAELQVPVAVARVVVADLVASGLVRVHQPVVRGSGEDSVELLERLIAGIQAVR